MPWVEYLQNFFLPTYLSLINSFFSPVILCHCLLFPFTSIFWLLQYSASPVLCQEESDVDGFFLLCQVYIWGYSCFLTKPTPSSFLTDLQFPVPLEFVLYAILHVYYMYITYVRHLFPCFLGDP